MNEESKEKTVVVVQKHNNFAADFKAASNVRSSVKITVNNDKALSGNVTGEET